jgi:hypothetical protein
LEPLLARSALNSKKALKKKDIFSTNSIYVLKSAEFYALYKSYEQV